MGLFSSRSLGFKLAVVITLLLGLFSAFNTYSTAQKERAAALSEVESFSQGIAETVLSSLNAMMVTGAIDDRETFLDLLKKTTPGLKGIRVFRSPSVTRQFGKGLPGEQPQDDLERKVLNSGVPEFVVVEDQDGRHFRAVVPFLITHDRGGVDCTMCHDGEPGDVNGAISMIIDLNNMDAKIFEDITKMVVVNVVEIVLLLAALLFVLYRIVIVPLGKISRVVRSLQAGDLSPRVGIKRSDEIGSVADGIDDFADDMQNEIVAAFDRLSSGDLTFQAQGVIRDGLEKTNESLAELVANITGASNRIATSSQKVLNSSEDLASGAGEQSMSIVQISSSMEEMSGQTRLNAKNAEQANDLAHQAKEAANRGNKQVDDVVDAMREINKASESISNIIKVIDEIAFQTNLLALNAAVEAARAGQHGKGFAVVAEEVRNLAGRSAKSAKETADLIDDASIKAKRGMEIAQITARALDEIVDIVNNVSSLIAEIAASSVHQAQGIEEANRGIADVDTVVKRNSEIAAQTTVEAEKLAREVASLREMLDSFTIDETDEPRSLPPHD